MVQIILICLTSALVFLVISNVSDYRRSINIIWKNLFLDDVRTPLPLPFPSLPPPSFSQLTCFPEWWLRGPGSAA